jgi:hypothetical protein
MQRKERKQMDDRTLLEAAAKAISCKWAATPQRTSPSLWLLDKGGNLVNTAWNPLKDDGDALRLAVQLKIAIAHDEKEACHYAEWVMDDDTEAGLVEYENEGTDAFAATRRAIVRAAAQIAGMQA